MTHFCSNDPLLGIVSTTLDSALDLTHCYSRDVSPSVKKIDILFHVTGVPYMIYSYYLLIG